MVNLSTTAQQLLIIGKLHSEHCLCLANCIVSSLPLGSAHQSLDSECECIKLQQCLRSILNGLCALLQSSAWVGCWLHEWQQMWPSNEVICSYFSPFVPKYNSIAFSVGETSLSTSSAWRWSKTSLWWYSKTQAHQEHLEQWTKTSQSCTDLPVSVLHYANSWQKFGSPCWWPQATQTSSIWCITTTPP